MKTSTDSAAARMRRPVRKLLGKKPMARGLRTGGGSHRRLRLPLLPLVSLGGELPIVDSALWRLLIDVVDVASLDLEPLSAAVVKDVNTLTRSAQFLDCFFEDDAGRGEDKRTGLSCPDRQAALAEQCLKRCAKCSSDATHLVCTGSYPNTVWHVSFGGWSQPVDATLYLKG